MKNSWKKIYDRICQSISVKKLSIGATIIFMFSMLPIICLTVVNRASGDDYGYGAGTHRAWVDTHSLIEVIKAVGETIKGYYYGWQGTWFSIALFSLQPEVFNKQAYILVTPLMLILWIGSTFYLSYELLMKYKKMGKWEYRLITVLFLLINIQFVPGKKSSLYWFNGCAHYMVPFTMCQFLAAWLLKYGRTSAKRYFIGVFICMILLGGSNYQAALLALIITVYYGTYSCFSKRKVVAIQLSVPIAAELVGLLISMLAPGNKVRGGEELHFTGSRVISTIGGCFIQEFRDAKKYLLEQPLVLIGMIVLFLILCEVSKRQDYVSNTQDDGLNRSIIKCYPILSCILLICMGATMQAPAIYADVEVSQGVGNTNFQVLLIVLLGVEMIISGIVANHIHYNILIPGLMLACVGILLCRHGIKMTTDYICYEYIVTGQAADYKEQMDLQTKLLTDTEDMDVVIPGINDWQGPLMHMPVTDNVNAWTNRVTAEFYGKNSIVAIPRTEWKEKYE